MCSDIQADSEKLAQRQKDIYIYIPTGTDSGIKYIPDSYKVIWLS